jgi:hypothetical protein
MAEPIAIHLVVLVLLDPTFGKELGVQLQQLWLIELLELFCPDVRHNVAPRVVLPVLPRCGIN